MDLSDFPSIMKKYLLNPFTFKTIGLIGLFVTGSYSATALEEMDIEYKLKDQVFQGFLVRPEINKGARDGAPGILVVHDWMGLTEKTKEKARNLAALGYLAFAADIYGKNVRPQDTKAASELAGKYKSDRKLFRAHLNAALEQLKNAQGVNRSQLGAIGFCFGGTGVIELARSGASLKGVVSFHGGLDSPEPALGKKIRARILALHGADDPYVPEKDLAAFESEMRNHKVDWQLIKYGGAVHSFTDKSAGNDASKGAAYHRQADERSWIAMKEFFRENFSF